MSFLDVGKDLKKATIEMPPLPPEEVVQAPPDPGYAPSLASPDRQEVVQDIPQDGAALQRLSDGNAAQDAAPSEESQADPAKFERHESAQAKNFRELREKEARTARERDELAQQIKELKSQIAQKDDFNLNPDDLVEGKHLAKVVKELQEQKELMKAYTQQRQFAEAEIRAASRYADFRNVVTPETLDALKKADPRRGESLQRMAAQDQEEALVMAYMSIKEMNLAPSAPRRDPIETQRAQQNSAKPRPLNTVAAQHTDSPISRMNAFAQGELTPEMQKQHLKEMNEARKGY
jgi:hypothetical protein